MSKTASSQAAWALLIEGVSKARLEAHRMRHLTDRALRLVEDSEQKEHLYRIAGDIIISIPKRLEGMEIALDRTSLALSKMGEEFLSARLPLSEKVLVDEAVSAAFGKSQFHDSVERVASRYIEARVTDSAGKPIRPVERYELRFKTKRGGVYQYNAGPGARSTVNLTNDENEATTWKGSYLLDYEGWEGFYDAVLVEGFSNI